MSHSLHLLSGKRKYLWGLILFSVISVICVAFCTTGIDDFNLARREVLLRRIGHEILLQSHDSTSRVLPIIKIAQNEYQVSFENEFTFLPDSLVNTSQRLLAKDPGAGDYIVNVLNCGNSTVSYGYAISNNKKEDIVACLRRKQPRSCYTINIKFKPTGIITAKKGYFLGSLPVLAFIGFLFLTSLKSKSVLPGVQETVTQEPGKFNLGSVLFDSESRELVIEGKTISLTVTENRVLLIFALSPNETIERSRLQKEIWEDDGVIVGRSLDMFISKLRKKLEFDPNINIVVIRGKGYKLEISA